MCQTAIGRIIATRLGIFTHASLPLPRPAAGPKKTKLFTCTHPKGGALVRKSGSGTSRCKGGKVWEGKEAFVAHMMSAETGSTQRQTRKMSNAIIATERAKKTVEALEKKSSKTKGEKVARKRKSSKSSE